MPEAKKTAINGTAQLLKYIKKTSPDKLRDNRPKKLNKDGSFKGNYFNKSDEVRGVAFKNFIFTGDFNDVEFIGCRFADCDFNGIWGFFVIFTKTKFVKCHFRHSRYSHIESYWNEVEFTKCSFRNIEWDEAGLTNIFFDDCWLSGFILNGVYPMDNVCFDKCKIENSGFLYINYSAEDEHIVHDGEFYDLKFTESTLVDTLFNSAELRNSLFYNTVLYKCGFTECRLASGTIEVDQPLKHSVYVHADFQTILKSEIISTDILKSYFNIQNGINIKELVSQITTAIQFQTVFISYSLKDRQFAKQINDHLAARGLRTFLWEKDAPAGKTVKDIMTGGIQKSDKILFIASEHSIKSKACQFELSTSRKKQEELWKPVLLPIYIDDYLFNVTKADIRPVAMIDEYWENIEELKRMNVSDFRTFNKDRIDEAGFEAAVKKLIEALKKEE